VEEDIRAINEYEKLVVLRHNERNKYRHILEEEKTKIIGHITKSIEKFDQEVFDLFQTKIKYNAAINQERVKIIRLAKLLNDSDKRKKQIQLDGYLYIMYSGVTYIYKKNRCHYFLCGCGRFPNLRLKEQAFGDRKRH